MSSNFDNVDNFFDGSTIVMHSRRHNQTCATDTRGSATHDHPINSHALGKSNGGQGHLFGIITKLQFCCKSVDQIFRQDRSNWLQSDYFVKLFEAMSEFEYINLKHLAVHPIIK